MQYSYPLKLRFKLMALAPRISLTDSVGNEVMYIQQKAFALREAIRIYNNEQEKSQIYGIKTNQIIDFGAQYFFYLGADETSPTGSIKEQGLKTLFKATYTIFDRHNNPKFVIKETNAWVKVGDYILSQIPLLGLLTGHFFNPSYQVTNLATNQAVMLLKKEPSFFERQFSISVQDQSLPPEDEIGALLGLIMMVLLQRGRG
jgi:hypothetical protein